MSRRRLVQAAAAAASASPPRLPNIVLPVPAESDYCEPSECNFHGYHVPAEEGDSKEDDAQAMQDIQDAVDAAWIQPVTEVVSTIPSLAPLPLNKAIRAFMKRYKISMSDPPFRAHVCKCHPEYVSVEWRSVRMEALYVNRDAVTNEESTEFQIVEQMAKYTVHVQTEEDEQEAKHDTPNDSGHPPTGQVRSIYQLFRRPQLPNLPLHSHPKANSFLLFPGDMWNVPDEDSVNDSTSTQSEDGTPFWVDFFWLYHLESVMNHAGASEDGDPEALRLRMIEMTDESSDYNQIRFLSNHCDVQPLQVLKQRLTEDESEDIHPDLQYDVYTNQWTTDLKIVDRRSKASTTREPVTEETPQRHRRGTKRSKPHDVNDTDDDIEVAAPASKSARRESGRRTRRREIDVDDSIGEADEAFVDVEEEGDKEEEKAAGPAVLAEANEASEPRLWQTGAPTTKLARYKLFLAMDEGFQFNTEFFTHDLFHRFCEVINLNNRAAWVWNLLASENFNVGVRGIFGESGLLSTERCYLCDMPRALTAVLVLPRDLNQGQIEAEGGRDGEIDDDVRAPERRIGADCADAVQWLREVMTYVSLQRQRLRLSQSRRTTHFYASQQDARNATLVRTQGFYEAGVGACWSETLWKLSLDGLEKRLGSAVKHRVERGRMHALAHAHVRGF